MNRILLLILINAFGCPGPLMAQQFDWIFNPFSAGIHNQASRHNNLWLGSYSGGLLKYNVDSERYAIYNTTSSPVLTNNIKVLGVDHNGKVWINDFIDPPQYIQSLEDNTWITYDLHSLFPSKDLYYIEGSAIAPDNSLWVSLGTGVIHYDGSNWTFYDKTNTGIELNDIQNFTFDSSGNLYLASGQDSAFIKKFDGKSWTDLPVTVDDLGINYKDAEGLAYSDDTIWVATGSSNRLLKFFNNHWTYDTYQFADDYPAGLLADQSGNLWISTLGGHIYKRTAGSYTLVFNSGGWTEDDSGNTWILNDSIHEYHLSNWIVYPFSNRSFDYNDVLMKSHDGTIWIDGGDKFFQVKDSILKTRDLPPQYYSSDGLCSLEDSSGTFWFVAGNNFIRTNDFLNFESDTLPFDIIDSSGLANSNYANAIQADHKNNLIAAFTSEDLDEDDGKILFSIYHLLEFDGTSWTNLQFNRHITAIAVDNKNTIWVISNDSLYEHLNENWKLISPPPAHKQLFKAIAFDLQGNLIAAIDSEVYSFHDSQWMRIDLPDITMDPGIATISVDLNNNYLIGTSEGGLIIHTPQDSTFVMNSLNSNMPYNSITNAYTDADGNIWAKAGGDVAECLDVFPELTTHISSPRQNIPFYVYPNPTAGRLYVIYQSQQNLTCEIDDATGRKMEQFPLSSNQSLERAGIDISGLSKGIYVLQVVSAKGFKFCEEIVRN